MPCAAEICCRLSFSWEDIFNRRTYRQNKLLRAVNCDHFKCVKRLIREGADVNAVNQHGLTPLMISIERGHVHCMNVLIAAGAEPDRVEHKNQRFWRPNKPALNRAASTGQWKCVEALINAGADVNITTENGFTPLMNATFYGHVKCVELLLNAGADVNMTNKHGKTAISQIPSSKYKTEISEMLIEAGADVNTPGLCPQLHLLNVIRQGTWRLIKLMIESGADVNVVDTHRNTALMAAAERNQTDEIRSFVRQLLEAGVRINMVNIYSAFTKQYRRQLHDEIDSCVRLLLQAGVRINITNSDQHNAFAKHYLRKPPVWNICLLLFAAGEKVKEEFIEEIKNSGRESEISRCFEDDLDLKHLCREAIRKHLINLDPHHHLFGRMPQLGRIPKAIVEYLVYNVSLQIEK